jgi:hypothetical protein
VEHLIAALGAVVFVAWMPETCPAHRQAHAS